MAGIRQAIEWIAENDQTAETDWTEMEDFVSVVLVADLFDKDPAEVARRVIKKRKEIGLI
jgi:hypothetical protein